MPTHEASQKVRSKWEILQREEGQSLPDYKLKPEVVRALGLIYLPHADCEQNCSTSIVRMAASSRAGLFASVASGVCALWDRCTAAQTRLSGEMLEEIHREGDDGWRFAEAAKDKKSGRRLVGFRYRVYKSHQRLC